MDNSTEQFNALAVTMNGNKRQDDQMPAPQYTIPGILHYLQTEWARFEMDRAQWEVDRAELQVAVVVCVVFSRFIGVTKSDPNYSHICYKFMFVVSFSSAKV